MLANDDKLMTIREAAELLSVTPGTLRNYCARGRLTRYKFFDETRLSRQEVLSHIIPGRTEWRAATAFASRRGQSV